MMKFILVALFVTACGSSEVVFNKNVYTVTWADANGVAHVENFEKREDCIKHETNIRDNRPWYSIIGPCTYR